jgi:ribosomal protein L37AE/L43A
MKHTHGLHEHSRLEEEYFYKKERELIEKLKETERRKKELFERTAHYHKCAKCGHEMEERVREDLSLLVCRHCESVHLPLATLDVLSNPHKMKMLLSDLKVALELTKNSA